MYLKSLEISGFKSFGKKGVLEFNSPITSIVGPNGSGKSNIAEAFRFVLGEQSIKSMRGKRGEDLIFNGTKDSGRQNRASVKMVFDNTKRVLDIDFDTVCLERVVHRDGINEYLINGSVVRLRDIIELLAKAHIGSSGHHIISQGEADRILNANLKERREMVEDALGLKIYQYKRAESERKLEKTEENIKSVESLRREITPHLTFLKKQVEKVEKALVMKDELTNLYLEYFKREGEYLKYEKSLLAETRRGPTEKLLKLERELATAKAVLAESGTKDKKSAELVSLEGKIRIVRENLDVLSRSLGRLEGSISAEERRREKAKHTLGSADEKLVHLKDVEELEKKVNESLKEAEGNEDLSKVRAILKGIRDIFSRFISDKKQGGAPKEIEDAEAELSRLHKEKKGIEAEIEKDKKEEVGYHKAYEFLKNDIEREKDSSRDAEKAIFKIMAEQNEIHGELNVLKVREEKYHHEEEDFKRELGEAGHIAGRAIVEYENFKIEGEVLEKDRTSQEERRKRIEKIKVRLEDAGAGGAEDIMKEFREVSEREAFLTRELEDLKKSSASLEILIKELEQRLDIEFKEGVIKINKQFQDFFALMFGGGTASLEVVRETKKKKALTDLDLEGMDEIPEDLGEDEEEGKEGIDISVSLPRKKTKGLSMLSGGERALTSIALIFAVSQVNPPPFIILDETDAALDEANSKKYGDMIENLSKYSQLILITHNRETMSRAGVLYGITMGSDGISKLLSIAFEEAAAVAK
ncbi:MAG: AAA family ATPase [Candidatus Pacebacteria bacterium]|nr:AAA family ATPase [Candidatus Paceibacterota bacterium]